MWCLIQPFVTVYLTICTTATAESVWDRYKKNDRQLTNNAPLVIAEEFRDSLSVPYIMCTLYAERTIQKRKEAAQKHEKTE